MEPRIMEVTPGELGHFVELWCNYDSAARNYRCRLW